MAQATVERNTNAASFMRTFLTQRTSTVNLMTPGIRDFSLVVPEDARLVFTHISFQKFGGFICSKRGSGLAKVAFLSHFEFCFVCALVHKPRERSRILNIQYLKIRRMPRR
jgi:hypothetical protein